MSTRSSSKVLGTSRDTTRNVTAKAKTASVKASMREISSPRQRKPPSPTRFLASPSRTTASPPPPDVRRSLRGSDTKILRPSSKVNRPPGQREVPGAITGDDRRRPLFVCGSLGGLLLSIWRDTRYLSQPVEADEVASRLVELTLGEPSGLVPDMGGPRVYGADELLRSYLRATQRRRLIVPVWLPGKAASAFRDGANLAPEQAVGHRSWEEFLAERLTQRRPAPRVGTSSASV